MYRNSSRFNLALILGAHVLTMMLLGGCAASVLPMPTNTPISSTPTPIPKPTWTPVPLATWVAQGIPADTLITWKESGGPVPAPSPGDLRQIVIDASGTITCADYFGEVIGGGRISQDKLGQILFQFAQVDFFSLAFYAPGCVYRAYDPPDLARMPTLPPVVDAGLATISITVNGKERSVRHYQVCKGEGFAELEHMIVGVAQEQLR